MNNSRLKASVSLKWLLWTSRDLKVKEALIFLERVLITQLDAIGCS